MTLLSSKGGSQQMTTVSFPTDPGSRKVILVLSQHDIERCTYEPNAGKALLDPETFVLGYPLPRGTNSQAPVALRNIIDSRLASPGSMLLQSPFMPDEYQDVANAPRIFALAKHTLFPYCASISARRKWRSIRSTFVRGPEKAVCQLVENEPA